MIPIRRAAASLALALALALPAAAPAAAACGGPSLLDRLSPTERAALDAAVAATPFGEGLLWEAERGPARVLLVGTMHLPDERHQPMADRLAPAVRAADLVLVEATPAEEAAMARAMVDRPELFFITEGPTLPERLPPEDWAALSEAAGERGVPPFVAAKFRPWFLMLALSLPPCAMEEALAGGEGLDRMVMDEAEAAGTPLAALEPWHTLPDAMGTEDEPWHYAALDPALFDDALAEAMMVAMAEGYFAGRIAEIWELGRLAAAMAPGAPPEAAGAFAAMEGALLDDRNAAWVPVIEEAAAANPRLVVAAGAAHLPGARGVLSLLQERGWTVRPAGEACCDRFWEG